jgi:hypothetical protein
MSDLHLELGKQYETFHIPARAPYLVIAGDTGRLKDSDSYLGFLAKLTGQFMRVFLVLGNHEFYGISRQDGLKLAKSLEEEACLFGRLTVLDRTLVEMIPEFVILGCTLHSHIPRESHELVRLKSTISSKFEDGLSTSTILSMKRTLHGFKHNSKPFGIRRHLQPGSSSIFRKQDSWS